MTRCLGGITNSMDMSLIKLQETLKDREAWVCCSAWGLKESEQTERLNTCLPPARVPWLGATLTVLIKKSLLHFSQRPPEGAQSPASLLTRPTDRTCRTSGELKSCQ